MISNIVKGIYIHIPFCENICYYCDFTKILYNEKLADLYLEVLAHEISLYKINYNEIQSIYIGGGTPSSLTLNQLKKLFKIIDVNRFINLKEFTFETNPDQLDENKIVLLKENRINRISLGVQTFDEKILKSINRHHTNNNVYNVINLLIKYNIKNISIDLMYGFNNQSIDSIENDILEIEKLNINHISYYSLILEKSTVFYNENYKINSEDYEFDLYIKKRLVNDLKFEHYEVSNYAKDSNYSFHNLLYWNNDKYYGFGLGASGYLDNYRYTNTKSITKYLNKDFNITFDYYKNNNYLLKDEILVNFRKFNGIDLDIINQKYNIDFTLFFEEAIAKNKDKILISNNKLYFSEQGKLFLNDIIIDFIDEIGE